MGHPAQSTQGLHQPSHPVYPPQAGHLGAVHAAANAGFLAHRSSAESSFLTGFPHAQQHPHSATSLRSFHEAAGGCLHSGQWPLPSGPSPPSAFLAGFPAARSAAHVPHLGSLGTRKRKEHPGPCPETTPTLAGVPFGAPHAHPIPHSAGCNPLQPSGMGHALGGSNFLPPAHVQTGLPNAMAPHFPHPPSHPSMSPSMLPPYPSMCIPTGLNPAAMGRGYPIHMDPSPEEQRRLHEDVQAHLKAGHELLQALQCPNELPGMGLADLTNRANMSVSLSAGLPPLAGAPAGGAPQQGTGPMGHCLLPSAASTAAAGGCLEELQQQLSRPDLTAAIKGLGTASLGATLLLKAALQKQQSASSF